MSAMMEDRMTLIRVINRNPKPIHGRYAGRDYVFKPEVPLDVPEIVARHIFDFGKDDKTQALNRLGWVKTSDEMQVGMEMMNNITFTDPPEMIEKPADLPRAGRPKKGTAVATPPVAGSGTEGGALKAPPDGPRIGELESAETAEDDETF